MAFFNSAITVLQTLVVALGAGLGVWGVINLLEGYGNDNPGAKSQGMKQLMAGGGVALIGTGGGSHFSSIDVLMNVVNTISVLQNIDVVVAANIRCPCSAISLYIQGDVGHITCSAVCGCYINIAYIAACYIDACLVGICVGILCPNITNFTAGYIQNIVVYSAVQEHSDAIASAAALNDTAGDIDLHIAVGNAVDSVRNVLITANAVDYAALNIQDAVVADGADGNITKAVAHGTHPAQQRIHALCEG